MLFLNFQIRFYSSSTNPKLQSSATNNKTFWQPKHDCVGRVWYAAGDCLAIRADADWLHGVMPGDITQFEPRLLTVGRTVKKFDT